MIAIKVKQGDNELSFSFPENWAELTYKQFFEIIKLRENAKTNNFELIRIILGLEKEKFDTLPMDFFVALERVLLEWISQEVDFQKKELPEVFWLKDKPVVLPSNIGGLSIAQYKDSQELFLDIQSKAEKEGRELKESEMLELYPILLATYIQPILDSSEYSYKKADLLVADIWNCSGLDVLTFANFFFHKVNQLKSGTKGDVQKYLTPQSKYRQGMNLWQRAAALFSRSKK